MKESFAEWGQRAGRLGFYWGGQLDKLSFIYTQTKWSGPGNRRLLFYGLTWGFTGIGIIRCPQSVDA